MIVQERGLEVPIHKVTTEGQTTSRVESLARKYNYRHLGQGHLKQYEQGLSESNLDENFACP